MSHDLREIDILLGATQFQMRKAQEVFDPSVLECLQQQYRNLVLKRFELINLYLASSLDQEVSHD